MDQQERLRRLWVAVRAVVRIMGDMVGIRDIYGMVTRSLMGQQRMINEYGPRIVDLHRAADYAGRNLGLIRNFSQHQDYYLPLAGVLGEIADITRVFIADSTFDGMGVVFRRLEWRRSLARLVSLVALHDAGVFP